MSRRSIKDAREYAIKSTYKKISKEKLRGKYGGRCAYCNVRLARDEETMDHYLPKALGGTNDFDNLRLACQPCNGLKGDMHPDQWERVKPQTAPEPLATKAALLALIAQRARVLRGKPAPTTPAD